MRRADLPLLKGGLPADFLPLFLPQWGLHFLRGAGADELREAAAEGFIALFLIQKAARLLFQQSGGS